MRPIFLALVCSTSVAFGTTIQVTTTADTIAADGECSLREAITAANTNSASAECPAGASSVADLISFALSGPGINPQVFTITQASPLPDITGPVVIDGYTELATAPNSAAAGFNGNLRIRLNGGSAGAGANGIHLAGGSEGSTVRGLIINNFSGAGIRVASSNNVITGNFIGVNFNGTSAGPNGGDGVLINPPTTGTGTSNRIGGTTPAERNIISGNGASGIRVSGQFNNGPETVIQGNYIGTDKNGTASLPNAGGGIQLIAAGPNVLIGGTAGTTPTACTGACNLVSGNTHEISVGVDVPQITIAGNFIGTNATGTASLDPNPNDGTNSIGVWVTEIGLASIQIGGETAAHRNLISGLTFGVLAVPGILVQSQASVGIEGNYIGTDASGTQAVPNGSGVSVVEMSDVEIRNNLISGNGTGIFVDRSQGRIQGNKIGTQADGVSPLGNGTGIIVSSFNNIANVVGAEVSGGPGGNIIAYNDTGIRAFSSAFVRISTNSIFNNFNGITGKGIDRNEVAAGPRPNDPCDVDRVPNYPVLSSAQLIGANLVIDGTLDSFPNQGLDLEFFANDPSSSNQGRYFVGWNRVNVSGICTATFSVTLPAGTVVPGQYITATSTFAGNNTSEFSAPVDVTVAPSLSINDVVQAEGDSGTTNFVFTVTKSAATSHPITVNFATTDGSAAAGSDYATNSGTLSLSSTEMSKTITIAVNGDTTAEADETFSVTLTEATNASIADEAGAGTITNDDAGFDPNGDGQVNVLDVFYLINHLFFGQDPPVGSGDANGDGSVNLADVIYLLNHLYGGGPPPA